MGYILLLTRGSFWLIITNTSLGLGHMKRDNVINGCVAIEEAAASIYGRFMQMFAEERRFWEDLVNDEMQHSAFLQNADYLGILEQLGTTDLLPSITLIEKTLAFADNVSKQIKLNPVSLEDALKMSLKLEESMAETFANESILKFLSANDEFLLEKILSSERLHIDKIRNMMIQKGFSKIS